MTTPVRRAPTRPSRPLQFITDALATHGHRRGDGTAVIAASTTTLATEAGLSSPGTISYYLRTLEADGIVVARRPITIDLTTLGLDTRGLVRPATGRRSAGATILHLPTAPPAPHPVATRSDQIGVLVDQVVQLATLVAELAKPREPVAVTAKPREEREDKRQDSPPPFTSPREPVANPRGDRDALDQLLDRLAAHPRIDPAHLTAREPLKQALAVHPLDHARHAIDRILTDLDTDAVTYRNVFGCLHHKATHHDPDYFRPPPPSAIPESDRSEPPPVHADPGEADTAALAVLDTLDPDTLQRLEEATEARHRARPSFRDHLWQRLRTDPKAWRTELAHTWRHHPEIAP